ncbi:MAG: MBL fold metallo-hydrolase [Planctomycetota bacterium]|nr:MBL fold metallo-hydrolase [Planctomycetota bacterium]
MLSRRTFVAGAIGVGAGAAFARQPGVPMTPVLPQRQPDRPTGGASPATFFEWKPIAPAARVAIGSGGNSLVVRGEGAGLLIDCKNAPYAETLRREATDFAGPLAGVINTHHHADHTGGNHAFTADIETIAHEKCTPRVLGQLNRYISQLKEVATQLEGRTGPAADRLREEAKALYLRANDLKAAQFAPRTGVGDRHTRTIAGVTVELEHFGPGHTDNDLVVRLPALNIVHTGDLLFYRSHPFIDRASGAGVRSWIGVIGKIAERCDDATVVVPGHGEVTNKAGLLSQREYFETLIAHVERLIAQGRSRKEIGESDPGAFAEYANARFRPMALQAIYDELQPEPAAPPK